MRIPLQYWKLELNAGLPTQMLSRFGYGTRNWDHIRLWYLENSRMVIFFKHLGEAPKNRQEATLPGQ